MTINTNTNATADKSTQTTYFKKRPAYDIAFLLMPSRKRLKPNPTAAPDNEATASSSSTSTKSDGSFPLSIETSNQSGPATSEVKKVRSWYTLPRMYKSKPSTGVARESILASKSTNNSSVDLSKFEARKNANTPSRPSPLQLGKSKETTKLTVPDSDGGVNKPEDNSKNTNADENQNNDIVPPAEIKNSTLEAPVDGTEQSPTQRPATSAGLLYYIPIIGSRYAQQPEVPVDEPAPKNTDDGESNDSINNANEISTASESRGKDVSNVSEESTSTWWPWSSSSTAAPKDSPKDIPTEQPPTISIEPTINTSSVSDSNLPKPPETSRSWFINFPLSSSKSAESDPKDIRPSLNAPEKRDDLVSPQEDIPKFRDGTQPPATSAWGFFSRTKAGEDGMHTETGELAVVGDPSQNTPKPATITSPQKAKEPTNATLSTTNALKTPDSIYGLTDEHILLPQLKQTYKLMEDPSIIQQLAKLIRLNRDPKDPPGNQVVSIDKMPRKIKKAVAIGVHGIYPPRILRYVQGEVQGTSKLFANHASAAIHRWATSKGYECEVESVALHFDGRVEERVDVLYDVLLNSIVRIREADFVMFACHSQGVPVSVMLAAKLIDLQIIKSQKLGICAMAGVNMGPHPDGKTIYAEFSLGRWAGYELFNLGGSAHALSKTYVESLRKVLRFGARVTFIGSMDDQLVSMESATFIPAYHPYIYRAVFVNGTLHKPDFLVKLIAFALKLRNMGVQDHGLIPELSLAIRGSVLYGNGHSVIYDDPKVYDLALQHALETTSVGQVDLKVGDYSPKPKIDQYFLPFAVRGVLEERLAKTELSEEVRDLLEGFEGWKPVTKELQNVKQRLMAIKSML